MFGEAGHRGRKQRGRASAIAKAPGVGRAVCSRLLEVCSLEAGLGLPWCSTEWRSLARLGVC